MKPIQRNVFRAYDIRGVVDKDFDAEWVRLLGRAAGTYFVRNGWSRAVLGHDVRPSSPLYQRALAEGLCECGVDVILLGPVSTPMLYFAVRHLNLKAGGMITASHNPPQYNGFKLWGGETVLLPEAIAEVYEIMAAGEFTEGEGLLSTHDILPAYREELTGGLNFSRPVKVVVDGGNGAAGDLTADMLQSCGAEVVRMYCDPDPTFPNHHPDPVVEANMVDLMARVVAEGAELGIGLDGDGDRIGLVDESGTLLHGDRMAAIFARHALAQEPGATILGDVKCTDLYFKDIAEHGGKPIMSATGHSIIKARMLQTGAAFGGEFSGHVYFGGRFRGVDDATWAALLMVSLVAARPEEPLSGWLADWPRMFATREVHVPCPDERKFAVMDAVVESFKGACAAGECEVLDLDGARVVYADGWVLARASNTQPVIVVRAEASSEARRDEIRAHMEAVLLDTIEKSA